jgi:hypothetical protein
VIFSHRWAAVATLARFPEAHIKITPNAPLGGLLNIDDGSGRTGDAIEHRDFAGEPSCEEGAGQIVLWIS